MKTVLRKKYDMHIQLLSEKCKENPNSFWSFYRAKSKCNSIPDIVKLGSKNLSGSTAKANAFNEHFHYVFGVSTKLSSTDYICDDVIIYIFKL